jgi:uncharacterized membrane protein YhdT
MKKAMTYTLILWLAVVVIWGCLYVYDRINLPDSVGYETSWAFQSVCFMLVRFPILFIALCLFLCLEYKLFRKSPSRP